MLPLTPGAPWQKQSTCVIGSGFEKPLKTIKTTWKHKMMLKSLNCRGFSSGWNNFCFIKIILCVVIMDHRRRQWQPTPVLLPGESHGQRSLVGYSPWGHKESDTTERLHFTSCPLSQWHYLTVSSFAAIPSFSFCLQSFPASESFPMSQLYAWGGQRTGASTSVLPMNTQGRSPLG